MQAIREIQVKDIPALFEVRIATRENVFSMEELAALGITPASVEEMMESSHRGWLCEVGGRVVGFAVGNRITGEIWVIALLPEYEKKGIGGHLMDRIETWLWEEGWSEIWLTTDLDMSLRAYGFYRQRGWLDWKIVDGLRFMKKVAASK